jgi:ATP-dependent Clp protease ATP-binding subunit ClpA
MGALTRARSEASELGNESVKPEHILLGLVSDPESSVVRMLRESAADPEQVRTAVIRLLNRGAPDSDDASC